MPRPGVKTIYHESLATVRGIFATMRSSAALIPRKIERDRNRMELIEAAILFIALL